MANGSFLSELGGRLPQIALAILAARQGGMPALGAFQGGMLEAQQRSEAQARQAQLDEERRQQQASAEQRATESASRADEDQRLQRLQTALNYLQNYEQQVGQTATDPTQAENALLGRASSLEGMFNVPQGQLSGAIPPMAPVISTRKKRQAQEIYERAEKTYGAEAMASDSITLKTELFGEVKPSALRAMFTAPAVTATGEPAMPVTGKPDVPNTPEEQFYATYAAERNTTWDKLPTAEKRKARAEWAAAGRDPQAPSRQGPTLTPNEALRTTRSLRNDFIRETSSAREAVRQLELMKSSLAAVKSGAAAPGSQGVLVTFQKILDPTSVVRESEYARSAAGLSLISRMEGMYMRWTQGGAGVPVEELENFVALAEQFAKNQARFAAEAKGQIDAIAKEYGLNPSLITRDIEPLAEPQTTDGWIEVEGGIRIREKQR